MCKGVFECLCVCVCVCIVVLVTVPRGYEVAVKSILNQNYMICLSVQLPDFWDDEEYFERRLAK